MSKYPYISEKVPPNSRLTSTFFFLSTGEPSLSKILLLYSVCIHGPLTVVGCFIIHDCINGVILLNMDYITTLLYVLIVTATAASMTTFLLVWLELRKFIKYLNSWNHFQVPWLHQQKFAIITLS